VIAGVVVLHVWALHVAGQNNPAGVEPKTAKDTVPFTPYATMKDAFGVSCFMLFFAWFIFYMPNYLGEADNYIPANPGVTPAHIVPEWYYLPFYAILRSIPNKLAGVVAMFGAILILAFLPWLDTARTKSSKYRPLAKQFFWIFVVVCLLLGWLGAKPAEGIYVIAGRVLTFCYFAYFLIVLPLLSRIEKPRPVPNSISDDVLAKSGKSTVSTVIALAIAGALFAGSAQDARAAEGQEAPPSQKWSFAGRSASSTAARCSAPEGLQGSLRLLPRPVLYRVPQPRRSGRSRLFGSAGGGVRLRIQDQGRPERCGRYVRAARPAGRLLPSPFPNDNAARAANGGALPPDLSLITKARSYPRGFPMFIVDLFTQFQEQGPNYVSGLLQGYEEKPPAGFTLPEGSSYNKYFPGHAIKMPNPLSDGQVTYDDGSPATVAQYAKDVTPS